MSTKEFEAPDYFLGIALPEQEADTIRRVWQELGTKKGITTPPHITVKRPFYYPNNNEEQLVAQLIKWAKTQRSFEVKLSKVGSFERNRVVFLAPERGRDFKQLLGSLNAEVENLPSERREYVPHLMLIKRTRREDLAEIKKKVRQMGLKLKFKADALILFKRAGEEPWREYLRFSFG